MQATAVLTGLVGVYHADGGAIGEAKYVIGKLMGTAHCALCDITHSPVRRKPAWDRMVADLGVAFELLHLNEMPPAIAAATARHGSPVVLGRFGEGTVEPLLLPADLEMLGGSIDAFSVALRGALARVATTAGDRSNQPVSDDQLTASGDAA